MSSADTVRFTTETFEAIARDGQSREASIALFNATGALARDEDLSTGQRRAVAEQATRDLENRGLLPLVSFEYLRATNNYGDPTNFEIISELNDEDSIIDRFELETVINGEPGEGVFTAPMLQEIKDNYAEVADLDGEIGISQSDVNQFIEQQVGALNEPLPEKYQVQSGDGFDRIAQAVFEDAFEGKEPTGAQVIALSEAIAKLNGNDRNYTGGSIHPGQELELMSREVLEDLMAELDA